ncbi:hypothetical protein V8E52_006684 [Russula decolorans]
MPIPYPTVTALRALSFIPPWPRPCGTSTHTPVFRRPVRVDLLEVIVTEHDRIPARHMLGVRAPRDVWSWQIVRPEKCSLVWANHDGPVLYHACIWNSASLFSGSMKYRIQVGNQILSCSSPTSFRNTPLYLGFLDTPKVRLFLRATKLSSSGPLGRVYLSFWAAIVPYGPFSRIHFASMQPIYHWIRRAPRLAEPTFLFVCFHVHNKFLHKSSRDLHQKH